MTSKKFERLTSAGTSQEGRVFAALDFDYVKVDERKFEDLLVFAAGFSKLVNYYNLNNEVDGDWSGFLSDETVILATIVDSDPSKTEAGFKKNISKARLFKRPHKKLFYFKKCFKDIYHIALRFQDWYDQLKAVEAYTDQDLEIKNEISNAISSKLSNALSILIEQLQQVNHSLNEDDQILLDLSKFSPIWSLQVPDREEEAKEHSFEKVSQQLEKSFQAFFETLLYLRLKAPEYLQKSLKSDTHYPEVSLFLAFLKLFQFTQENINKLTERHLEFYYKKVLKQKPKPAIRDQVYLNFKLYDTATLARINMGTAFYAGEDAEGGEIVYHTDSDILVNHSAVERLRTIYIDRAYYNIKGEPKERFDYILYGDIPVSELNKELDDNSPGKLFATFGESQEGKGSHEKTMRPACVGFAISSPVLFLKEGSREITLILEFSKESFKTLKEGLSDLSELEKNLENEVFVKCFLEAFDIDITGPEGWHKVQNYVISEKEESPALIISFDLGDNEPSVVKFDPEVHKGEINAPTPVVRFTLSNNSFVYPYSLLKDLILEEVEIVTHVSGVKDLTLFNNIGQLSSDNPFYPFGPMPNVGSYLLIGSNEAFRKDLSKVNINIEWFDLPRSNSGFWGHYKEYGLKVDNTSFEAKVSVLDGARWKPTAKDQQTIKLFRSEDEPDAAAPKARAGLDKETYINNIDMSKISLSPDYGGIKKGLTYTNTTQRGFIKLELSNPEHAFAHSIYPSVLSDTAIRNSRTSFFQLKGKKIEKQPNAPYTPQIKSISLDYTASSVISLRDRSRKVDEADFRGNIYHIHPFGENLVFPDTSSQETYLLPDYNFEGALMIGLKNLNPPQTVSFLFDMFDDYTVSSEEGLPVIEWSFLANNVWSTIKPSKIIRDDTKGFIKTGIIEVELPFEINRNNTIMDPDLFWIRASVIKNREATSKTLSVYTQVVTATLDEKFSVSGNHLNKPLPPFTIERSVENIEGVEAVCQPLESFGGIPEEQVEPFYIRVSERLRHKSRAIMPWDYERLILNRFSDVNKVACLPNMNSGSMDAPGNILLVISPKKPSQVEADEPMASSELLHAIKTFLSDIVSPFVKLEVRNPAYERIKIICAVKFKDGYNYGYFLQNLNEELKRYLSQGQTKENTSMNLGGRVNSSDILSFMRTLPYVDFITRFSMVQAARDFAGNWVLADTAREGERKFSLEATKPWSILVPAMEHQITVLNERTEERSHQAGIDSLELGSDFIIE